MAGSAEESTTSISSEIESLKSNYDGDVRVIKNIGIYAYVISLKKRGDDLTIKFQIENDYPQVAPVVIIKSTMITEQQQTDLIQHLTSLAESSTGKEMIQPLVDATNSWLKDQGIYPSTTVSPHKANGKISPKLPVSPTEDKRESPKPRRNNAKNGKNLRRQQRRKNERTEEEETASEKLPSMKTAEDVISRIFWDEKLQADWFIVGYIERYMGLVEKSILAFSWEDIASVDYDTLAIPKHRIQHFKYKDEKVWDKTVRLDNFYGSTGSGVTIYDVIERYDRDHAHDAEVRAALETCKVEDDDSDDDGVVIYTGDLDNEYEYQVKETDARSLDEPQLYPREKYWGAKIRPTHFLALRITNPTVVEAIKEAHAICAEIEPSYMDCILPPVRLHITLCCLGLDTEEDVQNAVDTLQKIKPELEAMNPTDIELTIKGTGNFRNETLYARIQDNKPLMDFVNHLKICLQEAGVCNRDIFDFIPHMTIMKLTKEVSEVLHTPYVDARVYPRLEDKDFGTQVIDNVHLCEMTLDRNALGDNFYVCPTELKFEA